VRKEGDTPSWVHTYMNNQHHTIIEQKRVSDILIFLPSWLFAGRVYPVNAWRRGWLPCLLLKPDFHSYLFYEQGGKVKGEWRVALADLEPQFFISPWVDPGRDKCRNDFFLFIILDSSGVYLVRPTSRSQSSWTSFCTLAVLPPCGLSPTAVCSVCLRKKKQEKQAKRLTAKQI
jgi:hypothetical protein